MAFTVPGQTVPKLPRALELRVERSVEQFRQRFGSLLLWAEQQGWIVEYRREITALAGEAYRSGRHDEAAETSRENRCVP